MSDRIFFFTSSDRLLFYVKSRVYAEVDNAAIVAQADIAHQVSSARRAIGQHFRKLKKDIINDQNTQ